MDVVRAFYQAVNSGDAAAIAALYAPDCTVEYVFEDDAADGAGESRSTAGYSHFWVEGGLIRRHRTIRQQETGSLFRAGSREKDSRFPIVGIGAVILTDEGQVVLVKRRNEPLAGQWSLPGGGLELGESLEAGTAREVVEETGLVVTVGPMIEVFDRILVNDDDSVRFHFVLVDYLCWPRGGRLQAGSDVEAVTLVDPADLAAWRVAEKVRAVVARALELQTDIPRNR
jgi:8-oxo-dGTP diphosphatase